MGSETAKLHDSNYQFQSIRAHRLMSNHLIISTMVCIDLTKLEYQDANLNWATQRWNISSHNIQYALKSYCLTPPPPPLNIFSFLLNLLLMGGFWNQIWRSCRKKIWAVWQTFPPPPTIRIWVNQVTAHFDGLLYRICSLATYDINSFYFLQKYEHLKKVT